MEEIKLELEGAIKRVFGIDFEVEVVMAPEGVGADYASNVAMRLAGILRRKPMEIAGELETELLKVTFGSKKGSIAVTAQAPGFLNFNLPDEYFLGKMAEIEGNFEKNISRGEYLGKTVICEFSDPNPFKILHVGHLYTSVVGDAISRLFEVAGAKVVRANFGGDVGLHVGKTLWALVNDKKLDIEKLTIEEIAEHYMQGSRAYEEDEVARGEIVKLNKEIFEIVKKGKRDSALAELYWRGRELSYKYFEQFYDSIGVKFDKYYPESTVAERGLTEVKKGLAEGVYERSDGAVVYKGEKHGLHTRVFINKAGLPTYEAKDVGLIFTKWEDYRFDKSMVITGNDIVDYMKVVLRSVGEMNAELVKRTIHLTHGQVKLVGGVKMSSRRGNFLKAVEVMEMVGKELAREYGSKDRRVLLSAVKYAFLKYKIGGDIIFDLKESVKMTGNSGPYLLYSVVRAKKILERVQFPVSRPRSSAPVASLRSSSASQGAVVTGRTHFETPVGVSGYGLETRKLDSSNNLYGARSQDVKLDSGDTPCHSGYGLKIRKLDLFERALVKKMVEYKGVVAEAMREMAPHKLAGFLYELAQEFSRFYENCAVVGDEREGMRGEMVAVYVRVMEHGLGILGIEVPEEM